MKRQLLLVALTATLCLAPSARAAESEQYGLESVGASLSTTQAGDHPELDTSFEMKTDSVGFPFSGTRDVEVDLPPGLLANLSAFPQCSFVQFQSQECPFDSQLGIVDISAYNLGSFIEPLYYLTRGPDTVARLGYYASSYPNVINVRLRSEDPLDYGASASVEGILSAFPPTDVTTTIWAVPADPAHDALRITPEEARQGEPPPGGGRPSNLPPFPLTINPTRCGMPLAVTFTATSYQLPTQPSSMSAPLGPVSGCGQLSFAPALTAIPTTREAAASSGVDVELTLPQNESVKGLATSHIRHAEVTFPEGMTIASGAAEGQQACSDAQAGYESRRPAQCPDASKLGTVDIDVPLLERPLHGGLYLRTPEPGDLFRVWLIADDLGAHIALPGELEVDKATGQITSTFVEMPQAPVRKATIHVFGGAHGPLATPSACGSYATKWRFTPWSGTPPSQGIAPMTIDAGCDTGGFAPKLSAGTANPVAGAFSTLVVKLTRASGEQNLSGIDLTLPPGATAKLAGVPLCEGAAAQSGKCPPGSQVGKVVVAAGPGPSPLWLPQPGKELILVYLAGPYKGAPLSLVIPTPAQAGPFDLGTVITRAAIYVDPYSAQATVKSDPLPQILEGVPISYRTIEAEIDRPSFALNPTSCKEMAAQATLTSDRGATAQAASRYQLGGCRELGFKPKLSLRLFGKTNRGAHPRLRAMLRLRPGGANISRARVALPRSEFLDQSHIRTVCTRVQFSADQCPSGSVYGHATAFTPLLDEPLRGPVYLRSSNHLLPDLVVALKGQIDVNAVGRIDSIDGGIRTTFSTVPDAPIDKFVLTMQGANKGLLVNSRNLCGAAAHALVEFEGQNGKGSVRSPTLRSNCAKPARRK